MCPLPKMTFSYQTVLPFRPQHAHQTDIHTIVHYIHIEFTLAARLQSTPVPFWRRPAVGHPNAKGIVSTIRRWWGGLYPVTPEVCAVLLGV